MVSTRSGAERALWRVSGRRAGPARPPL